MLLDVLEFAAKTVGLPLLLCAVVWWYMKGRDDDAEG